jgi:ElaB/YqjD/DUF883 family membrane-anchored ribosome-binding protein
MLKNKYEWIFKTIDRYGVATVGFVVITSVLWFGFVVPQNADRSQVRTERETLMNSMTTTNETLMKNNDKMAEVLTELKSAFERYSKDTKDSVDAGFEVVQSNAGVLSGLQRTHDLQTQQLTELKDLSKTTNSLMESAATMMAPAGPDRKEMISLLKELTEEAKRKKTGDTAPASPNGG